MFVSLSVVYLQVLLSGMCSILQEHAGVCAGRGSGASSSSTGHAGTLYVHEEHKEQDLWK